MKSTYGLSGKLRIENTTTGEVREIPNTIMNVGKSVISSFIGSDITQGVAFDFMSIGTSGITAAATQTTLGSEQLRQGTVSSQSTTTTTGDTATFVGSFAISGTLQILEAGIFNASSAGSMLARTTFSAINVVSGDSINASWDVIVA